MAPPAGDSGQHAGNAQVNSSHIFLPLMHGEAPELIDQYAKAFEKVWAQGGAGA